MSLRRKLTEDEKAKVWSHAIEQARAENPRAYVDVTVDDVIDENGQAHWTTCVTTEHLGPFDA